MTYIISVANEKGGVAKTTTAISLGAALVETGLEVLLVDLDGQANLSLAFGIETSKMQTRLSMCCSSPPRPKAQSGKPAFPAWILSLPPLK